MHSSMGPSVKQNSSLAAGIDQISFYTSPYYLPLTLLAAQRGVDPNKYLVGLGQETMAVPAPDEDAVTLAANAAHPLMHRSDPHRCDPQHIGLLLFATESSVDQSKAAGLFVHKLLKLPARCQVIELKQACYAGAAALRYATRWAQDNPHKKALVLTADIARYELNSPGEPTQGCGAVALLVSANPRVLALDSSSGFYAQEVADFWRPNHKQEPIFDGKYSAKMYLTAAWNCWQHYTQQTQRQLHQLARVCYHLPLTNMACKAHAYLMTHISSHKPNEAQLMQQIADTLPYNRLTGNTYTASLFESLTCLLDRCQQDLGNQRIGLFAYGSGCMGEFFSAVVQPHYKQHLLTNRHRKLLNNRTQIGYDTYEAWFNNRALQQGPDCTFAASHAGPFRLAAIKQHKRIYVSQAPAL
ncbi:MAG: hydroxymethylglutaryl-CoA synthase [Myxococcota bacterium]